MLREERARYWLRDLYELLDTNVPEPILRTDAAKLSRALMEVVDNDETFYALKGEITAVLHSTHEAHKNWSDCAAVIRFDDGQYVFLYHVSNSGNVSLMGTLQELRHSIPDALVERFVEKVTEGGSARDGLKIRGLLGIVDDSEQTC